LSLICSATGLREYSTMSRNSTLQMNVRLARSGIIARPLEHGCQLAILPESRRFAGAVAPTPFPNSSVMIDRKTLMKNQLVI
jgi:hypothetical protein